MKLSRVFAYLLHRRRWVAWSAEIDFEQGVGSVGKSFSMASNALLSTRGGGSITMGDHCEIGIGTIVLSSGGDIKVGNHCRFNPYCVIYGHGGLTIGNYVRIAAHSVVVPFNHVFDRTDVPIHDQGHTQRGVRIDDDVWIGAGVKILDGVTIGRGCVVAAGAVVTRSLPPYSICAGVPARVIRHRDAP